VPELPSPRLIKSHDIYSDFEKGTKGKFIFVYRNVEDVAISLYHQTKNYRKPDIKLNDYMSKTFLNKKGYDWFSYTQSWLRNKNKHHILYLRYEDILKDKGGAINKIINFLEIKPTKEAIERAIERSSFDYMKKLESKFGLQPPEKPSKLIFNEFIREGKVGKGKDILSQNHKEKITALYTKHVKDLEKGVFNNSAS
jgi:hypothetical protein